MIHDFDADPGWLGPKKMTYFESITDSHQRLLLLNKERHKGSNVMVLNIIYFILMDNQSTLFLIMF